MSVAELEIAETRARAADGRTWNEAWYRLTHNWGALVGAAIVGIFVICALFAPLIAPSHPSNDVYLVNGILQPQPPSMEHWLGLDIQGRDVFSRIVYGARYSLLIGVVSVAIGLSIGTLLGSSRATSDAGPARS